MATAKEEMLQRDNILDEYENGIGIAKFQRPGEAEELERLIIMNRNELEGMDSASCGYIAYRLAQFAFHIQRAQNREVARISWAENEIELTIATELQSYNGYGYKEKASQAIKGNSHASILNKIKVYAQQRADRLSYQATGLKNLADIMRSIQMNKRDEAKND